MSRINGDKARNDRQRKHREKMRVKNRALREDLVASAKSVAIPAVAAPRKDASK